MVEGIVTEGWGFRCDLGSKVHGSKVCRRSTPTPSVCTLIGGSSSDGPVGVLPPGRDVTPTDGEEG